MEREIYVLRQNYWGVNKMIEKEFIVKNKLGFHARAAVKFVQLASKFKSNIVVVKDDIEVSGKSIMGVLMLAASKGTKVKLKIDGEDENQAMEQLGGLIDDGFGED